MRSCLSKAATPRPPARLPKHSRTVPKSVPSRFSGAFRPDPTSSCFHHPRFSMNTLAQQSDLGSPHVGRGRLATASMVGTSLEWYDFTIYNTLSALVFNHLFFPSVDPLAATWRRDIRQSGGPYRPSGCPDAYARADGNYHGADGFPADLCGHRHL